MIGASLIGGMNVGRALPNGVIPVEQGLLVPMVARDLCQDPASDTAGFASSVWAQNTSATGAIPAKRHSILSFLRGYNFSGFDLHPIAIVQPIASVSAVVAIGTLRTRLAIALNDNPFEVSNTLKALPGSQTALMSTGLGITFDAARAAWSSATGSGTLGPMLRYDISGGLGEIIPAGRGFTLGRLDECAYTNAGITPSPEAPTTGIFQYSSRGPFGINRAMRIGGQFNHRPSIYINGFIGDGTTIGIDDWNWDAAGMNGEYPFNQKNYSADSKIQGTTHLALMSTSLQTGTAVTFTSGATGKSSNVWGIHWLLCLPNPPSTP